MILKNIHVIPYQPIWPRLFEAEHLVIQEAFGANGVAIYHVGSTSIPGLCAKPIIDIIGVVKNYEDVPCALEKVGYIYKGEYNIPLRCFFSKRSDVDVNLHVYEEDHPEIELNLRFRDYLREHEDTRVAYGMLKNDLLKKQSSFKKNGSMFAGYTLGKDAFIRDVMQKSGFKRLRMTKCVHHGEIHYVSTQGFDTSLLTAPQHQLFMLHHGVEIIGYAHIELCSDQGLLKMMCPPQYNIYFLEVLQSWMKRNHAVALHA